MTRTPQDKYILLFETAKRSLLAADVLMQRIASELSSMETDIAQGVQIDGAAISPLLSCVAFVDFAHRFSSVVDALPLINKKAPEMRSFRAALASVEAARHHLQHMRGDLSSDAEILHPLLGSLSWTNESSSYTAFLSQPTRSESVGIVYDTQEKCWVAKHQYSVSGASINLDAVLSEMHAIFNWLTGLVGFSDPTFSELKWGHTQVLFFKVLDPSALPQAGPSDAPTA